MNQGLIPQRYAKALYKVALERGCTAQLYELMKRLENSFCENVDLERVMENPFVDAARKEALLLTAAGADAADAADTKGAVATFTDFVRLLERNKRVEFVRGAALAYIALYRKECNISTVTVTSATPLDPKASERLRELIGKHLNGATVEYREQVDPDLIGGFTVAIDNRRLDASIKNELKQLRLKLLSH
ncbi:MAG: ATP synthase F1 subunit delta [Muribaculaceae bacterium]|nr:ATP synthase F1 subunit delta [Muribaculaceae bacterium]